MIDTINLDIFFELAISELILFRIRYLFIIMGLMNRLCLQCTSKMKYLNMNNFLF